MAISTGLGNKLSRQARVSLERGIDVSGPYQGSQACLSSPFTPMLVCLYLGPTTVSLRGLSKRKGEVELWTRWSFQTSASASLEFLLTILDSIQTAAACHWTTREPQRSKRTPGGGAARASGGFAEAA